MPLSDILVSTAWLAEHLDQVKIIDSTFFLPTENRDAAAEYQQQHIPGAVFFDIDAISDHRNPLPHMFPSEVFFTQAVSRLGISNSDHIVCYDRGKTTGACRAWWMFRTFGHHEVAVLDGGFLQWLAEGHPVEQDQDLPTVATGNYQARFNATMVQSLEQVRNALNDSSKLVLDARSAGRFNGTAPEPRAGLRGGHMPGASNLPYDQLLKDDGTFKPRAEIKQLFDTAGVAADRTVITSCGSGVSAATLLLGLQLIGRTADTLYDGSWSEWGSREDTPVTT